MGRTAVSLGSNLGDRLSLLRLAVADLAGLGRLEGVSRLYETPPVGGPVQPRYLNAVVLLDTDLTPLDLLAAVQRVEQRHGRTRDVRWGPRSLDLDLVSHDAAEVSSPTLEIPHPRARERAFVLAPLAEVWPEAPVGAGVTALAALGEVGGRGLLRFDGDWLGEPPSLGARARWLVGAQFVLLVSTGVLIVAFGSWSVPGGVEMVVGGVLVGLGAVLGTWAMAALGSGLRVMPQPAAGARLVDRGPYRLVRHPIYGAILLGLAGATTLTRAWPAAAGTAAVAALYAVKARYEERTLAVNLTGYGDYLRRVRHRFLPFVW